jgi:thiamine transport system substrate-binding protein
VHKTKSTQVSTKRPVLRRLATRSVWRRLVTRSSLALIANRSVWRRLAATIATSASIALLAGCASSVAPKTVTLATHDSFVISKALQQTFERQTGFKLRIAKLGDAGSLTNKLILTKDSPVADAYFGVDNTFIGTPGFSKVAGSYQVEDFADVCVNYDIDWFAKHGVAAPSTYSDLVKPAYKNLTVTENITTSSTGLAFFAMTVGDLKQTKAFDFWRALKANGLKVDAGWEDAYYTDFSGSSGKGAYPIVISYSSSPADEVRANGKSQTAALTDVCFRQSEYAGVIQGAKNSAGAKALVEFIGSKEFQASMPESMYVYPRLSSVALPESWAKFAPAAKRTIQTTISVSQRKTWFDFFKKLFG